ncbi:MAG: phosphatidylserine decarboxylase [Actinomycetota bacterium]
MTRRVWETARPYVLTPLACGVALLLLGRRAGWGFVALAGALLAFFRDPERERERRPDEVYAVADGVVTAVEEVEETSFPGGRAVRVVTFLSLHDVHVNRSPVAGVVERIEEIGGGYAPALFSGAEGNRRVRLEIEGEKGPVVTVLRAGMVARRISVWVREGDAVGAGERIALIHLGSRADVLLPAGSVEALVHPGQKVRAGLTPLARYGA